MNKGIIYRATCLLNNQFYIGKTTKPLEERKKMHLLSNSTMNFVKALKEKGEQNFKWEIIEEVSLEKLAEREQYWIKELDACNKGYNQIKLNLWKEIPHKEDIIIKFKKIKIPKTAKVFLAEIVKSGNGCCIRTPRAYLGKEATVVILNDNNKELILQEIK